MLSGTRLDEAVHWCRRASDLCSDNQKDAYTAAFSLRRNGQVGEAILLLEPWTIGERATADIYLLLAEMYLAEGRKDDTTEIYRRAVEAGQLKRRHGLTLEASWEGFSMISM